MLKERKNIKAYKEYKYIVFEFEDGKTVKYDLSTGETIGKLGKPVKSLNTQLKGYNVYSVIDIFEDENYKKLMRFILKYFVNNKRSNSRRGVEVNRVTNIGTFLSKIDNYSHFEQFFAAGYHDIDPDLSYKLSDIPKQLLKLCKQYDLHIDNNLIRSYNQNSDDKEDDSTHNRIKGSYLFLALMSVKCESLNTQDRLEIFTANLHYDYSYYRFYDLITTYNYNVTSLIKYMDNLITFEAIRKTDICRELYDYARMMSEISPKFDKYPKNFLTTHRIANRNYQRLREYFEESKFTRCIDLSMEWKYDKFKFIYPKTVQDIKDEAVQQNNCVASYIERVIKGECHIMFLRSTNDVDHSLVTVEVVNNTVVQAKGKFNKDITAEESAVINKYNKYLINRFKQTTLANMVEMEAITC